MEQWWGGSKHFVYSGLSDLIEGASLWGPGGEGMVGGSLGLPSGGISMPG